jgi:hypothetical protein
MESEPALAEHHGGSYGAYMHAKISKLYEQVPQQQSRILEGVRAYVNGLTRPSLQELRFMISSHGGRFVPYWFHKSDLTHVIAENLPSNKIEELRCVSVWFALIYATSAHSRTAVGAAVAVR